MKEAPHISWVISDVQQFSSDELFDLIIVAEVLYYVGDLVQIRAAVRNLVGLLAPGGHLVFGSARDANCQRWGHAAGAETTIAMVLPIGRSMSEWPAGTLIDRNGPEL